MNNDLNASKLIRVLCLLQAIMSQPYSFNNCACFNTTIIISISWHNHISACLCYTLVIINSKMKFFTDFNFFFWLPNLINWLCSLTLSLSVTSLYKYNENIYLFLFWQIIFFVKNKRIDELIMSNINSVQLIIVQKSCMLTQTILLLINKLQNSLFFFTLVRGPPRFSQRTRSKIWACFAVYHIKGTNNFRK